MNNFLGLGVVVAVVFARELEDIQIRHVGNAARFANRKKTRSNRTSNHVIIPVDNVNQNSSDEEKGRSHKICTLRNFISNTAAAH